MPDPPGARRGTGWLYGGGIVLVLAAAVTAFVLFARQRAQVQASTQQLATEQQQGLTVEVASAHKVAGSETLRLIGEAHPFQTAVLYAKVSGYLKNISVDKGDAVRANQRVAVIESPETDKQYQAAVADAHNKELIATRSATLVSKGIISLQQADQAEADAAVSQANLEQIGP
jgi:multidrug efflux pump subunit AcrA (membrane-fusion protein)